MKYQDKSVCLIDHGNMLEFAVKLTEDFGKVYFWSDWKGFLPDADSLQVGMGIPGVTRVEDFWTIVDDIDLFIFLDIYDADLQQHLRNIGKRVFGVGGAEKLELNRWDFVKWKDKVGLALPETMRVIGLEKLEEALHRKEFDKSAFIKVSKVRGSMETFHHSDWDMTKLFLDELSHNLGARGAIQEFIIEAEIDAKVEIGSDIFTVDGKYPEVGCYGIELKDLGYLSRCDRYENFPTALKKVNDKLSPMFKENQSRGVFSTEVRVGQDRVPYFIDFCARAGSPTMESEMEMYSNWAEILWEGSQGIMVTPKPLHKYGAIVMMHSEWAMENWQPIGFPDKIRNNIKLRDFTIIKGKYYVVPHVKGWNRIGSIVGFGNTWQAAVGQVKEVAGQIKAYKLDIALDAFEKLEEEISECKKVGITF